jgi:hypothetical protein
VEELPETPAELYNDPAFRAAAQDMASEDIYDDDDGQPEEEELETEENPLDSEQEF